MLFSSSKKHFINNNNFFVELHFKVMIYFLKIRIYCSNTTHYILLKIQDVLFKKQKIKLAKIVLSIKITSNYK